jgi:hypothetical protein
VLALVAVAFTIAAAAPDGSWGASALLVVESATLVLALWTSGVDDAFSPRSIVLVGGTLVVAVANVVFAGTSISSATGLLAAALVVITSGTVARGVAREEQVNSRSVLGAVSIYLLIGLFFMFVYGAVATIGSGPFFAQGVDGSRPLRFYFSYVTLATVGYGDYTPAGNLGHTLAVAEALLGQLYLVTVVALLVSRLRR